MAVLVAAPETKIGRIKALLLALLEEHRRDGALPTDGRFLFYELEQRGQARKPSWDDVRSNKRRQHGWPPGSQDLSDGLRDLRESGEVPWDVIDDLTRTVDVWDHAGSVADYLRERLEEARINPWGEEPPPLLLSESRGLQGVLRRIAARYCCPISGTAGQTNGHLRKKVAPLFAWGATGRRVLYLGDLDDQGQDIEANSRRVLERATGLRFGARWQRIGLTRGQVEAAGLKPIWKTDGRKRDKTPRLAYELEALGQATVCRLVEDTLASLAPEPVEDVLEREAVERERWRRALEEVAG